MLDQPSSVSDGQAEDTPQQSQELSQAYENATALGEVLRQAWQQAHGSSRSLVSTLVGADSLAVLIEEAFTEAELTLSQTAEGQVLLQRYMENLMAQIEPQISKQAQTIIGQPVIALEMSPNFKLGWLICLLKFGPASAPASRSSLRSL